MKQELETDYVHLEIKNGVLVGIYKKGLKINLPIAHEIVRSRLAFTENRTLPAMIYNQGVISMDKEARQFLSSADGIKGLKAAAIILDSPFGSFLWNFFLAVNKPTMPVRIFSNTGSASKWLAQFIS